MTVIDTKKNYFLVRFDDSDNSFAFGTHEMLTSPWGFRSINWAQRKKLLRF